MNDPLLVEIIAYAPTAFYHCTHCEVVWHEAGAGKAIHSEQLHNSLPADLAEEYLQMSTWVRDLFQRYCDRVVIKVIDVASLEGFWKSLLYGVRRYPAVIVDRKKNFAGGDFVHAGFEIERLLGALDPIP